MLEWLTGTSHGEYTGFGDSSKVLEAPETPAPVFAIRAFKSALFGTPGVETEDDEDLSIPIKQLKPGHYRRSSSPVKIADQVPFDECPKSFPKPETQPPLMASPTKSILVTPGAAATRRKTVSFGDGVVDNERKKSVFEVRGLSTLSGNITSQWIAKHPDEVRRGRSKFTQTLLEAREKKPHQEDELFEIVSTGDIIPEDNLLQQNISGHDIATEQKDEDVTTDLNEPRSQSGVYWKSEYESYRTMTNREMKKLIQYRSVAKSYARKKEAETLRLADKLRQEEAKVAQMELHVSRLAAGMVNGANDEESKKEAMVKELTKQTALALQYKQKVNTLRKTLEQHGVLDCDNDEHQKHLHTDEVAEKLWKTEEALELANMQLKEMTSKSPDMKDLQDLIRNSERKAHQLERENQTLKQSLVRFKQEMAKCEDRRKAKETRLKQREQKLENGLLEYRNRLRESSQEHRETVENLKKSLADEKKQMQEMIDSLRARIASIEQFSHANNGGGDGVDVSQRPQATAQHRNGDGIRSSSSSREHAPGSLGERVKFGSNPPLESNDMDRSTQKTSSKQTNPISKVRVSQGGPEEQINLHAAPTDNFAQDRHRSLKKYTSQADPVDSLIDLDQGDEEALICPDGSTPGSRSRTYGMITDPPSSPPCLPSPEPSLLTSIEKPKKPYRSRPVISPRPSMVAIPSTPPKYGTHQRRQSKTTSAATVIFPKPSKTAATATSGRTYRHPLPTDTALPSSRAACLAGAKRDAIPADRLAAAKARLKQKQEEVKKGKIEGKENVGRFDLLD